MTGRWASGTVAGTTPTDVDRCLNRPDIGTVQHAVCTEPTGCLCNAECQTQLPPQDYTGIPGLMGNVSDPSGSESGGGCKPELGFLYAAGSKSSVDKWDVNTWIKVYAGVGIGSFLLLAIVISYLLKHDMYTCIVFMAVAINALFVLVGVLMLAATSFIYMEFKEYEDQISVNSLVYAVACGVGTILLAAFGITSCEQHTHQRLS